MALSRPKSNTRRVHKSSGRSIEQECSIRAVLINPHDIPWEIYPYNFHPFGGHGAGPRKIRAAPKGVPHHSVVALLRCKVVSLLSSDGSSPGSAFKWVRSILSLVLRAALILLVATAFIIFLIVSAGSITGSSCALADYGKGILTLTLGAPCRR